MKLTLSLGALSAANIVILAFTQWFVLVTVGPGPQTDAFYASVTVPQLLLQIILGSLAQALVPMLAGESDERIRAEASSLLMICGGLLAALAVVTAVTAGIWVPLLFRGFAEPTRLLTVTLTRIQLMGMVFNALALILSAVHQARQRFIVAAIPSVIGDLVGLGVLIVTLHRYGIVAAAWSLVVAGVVQTVLLGLALGRISLPPGPGTFWKDVWGRMKPLVWGSAYYKSDLLVDRFLSSMAPAGGFSLFYLGQQLYLTITQVLTKAAVVPILPSLSRAAKAGDWRSFRHLYHRRLVQITALAGGGYVLVLLAGQPALRLLIGHGAVTEDNVVLLWQILVVLVGLFVGGVSGAVTTSAFYAQGDTRTPTRLGVWSFTAYIPLKVAAFLHFGLLGLAAATSVFYAFNLIMQLYLLRRHIIPRVSHETD